MREIADEIEVGQLPKASAQVAGTIPVIKVGDIVHHQKSPFIYECKTFLDDKNIKGKRVVHRGDVLLIYSHDVKSIGKFFVYCGQSNAIIGDNICVIKHRQNPKYLLHALNSANTQKQIKLASEKQNIFRNLRRLNFSDISNISIPLPPIEIQEQITPSLDDVLLSKIQLCDSLEKILKIRKKQYEYYREQLLTSDLDKWNIRTIEEISIEIYCGNKVTKEQLGTGDWPAIKCGDINSKLGICFSKCISFVDPTLIKRKKYFEFGDLLVSGVGHDQETSGSAAAYLGKQPGILGGMVYVVRHKQNSQFLSYMMSSRFCRKQIERSCCGGSVFNFFIKDLKKIRVPLPPLEVQEQIVSILEQLDYQMTKLNEDIQELTASRQQQYNYLINTTIN